MKPKQSDTAKRPPAGPASGPVEKLEAKQKQRRTRSSRDEVRAASSSSPRTKGGQRGLGEYQSPKRSPRRISPHRADKRGSKPGRGIARTTRDTVGKGHGAVPAASDSAHTEPEAQARVQQQPPTSSGPFRINETIHRALTERLNDIEQKIDRDYAIRLVRREMQATACPIGRIIEHCPSCETPCLPETGDVHFSTPAIDPSVGRVKQVATLRCPHCGYREEKILYSPYIGAMN